MLVEGPNRPEEVDFSCVSEAVAEDEELEVEPKIPVAELGKPIPKRAPGAEDGVEELKRPDDVDFDWISDIVVETEEAVGAAPKRPDDDTGVPIFDTADRAGVPKEELKSPEDVGFDSVLEVTAEEKEVELVLVANMLLPDVCPPDVCPPDPCPLEPK